MKSKKANKIKQKKPVTKTRKQLRKEKRLEKKSNRAQYYGLKKQVPGKFVLNPNNTEDTDRNDDQGIKVKLSHEDKFKNKMEREKKQQERLAKQQEKQRQAQLKRDNEEEEKVIKQLGKQLRLNKRKSKSIPKSFITDGLSYILDVCDDENRQLAVEAEKQLLGIDVESHFEDDFAMMTKTEHEDMEQDSIISDASDFNVESDDPESGDEKGEFESNQSDDEEFDQEKPPAKKVAVEKSKEWRDLESNQSDEERDNDEPPAKKVTGKKKKELKTSESTKRHSNVSYMDGNEYNDCISDEDITSNHSDSSTIDQDNSGDGTWEDIYGRKRDRDGHIISNNAEKYMPPAARLKQLEKSSEEKEKLARLRKLLKGLINRLAEHNMHTIATQIEDLYMSNSRHDINEMLSKLMMESIVAPVITPDRLIAEHMMLIAIIHANVGTEVGAHFLLSLVKKFNDMMNEPQNVENKELDNVILMISHLYNFKVYGSQLLYQILEKLIAQFTEKEIELILLILKTVGFLLRKDDPIALKELILSLQQKAAAAKSSNSRIQFMLDVLLAIKNNNMNKIPQYDPTHIEHLKKHLKSFLRKGNTVTQFNISLSDLLKVDERGKWWIVGSAWTGHIDSSKDNKISASSTSQYSQKILELARKQRMNTDIRRSIFCILMSAEDYLDAFEKILHLGLKDQQEREIIHVIVDCCLQEKKFNLYYAVLAQKFCDHERKYQIILQYSLWDKLKILNDFNDVQLHNLAKFLTHLFIDKGLPLSVLKIVQFGELDNPTMRLVRQIMLGILLHENTEACLHVFERISLSSKLQTLREGLRLFISHFVVKSADTKPLPKGEIQKLKERAELVDKALCAKNYFLNDNHL